MKKITIFLVAVCLCFSVSGCSTGAKPQSVVNKFFKAVKDCNSEDLKSTVHSAEGDKVVDGDMFADDTYKEIFKENAKMIKYKINSTTINGDSAVLKVDCTYGDASEVFGIALKSYMQKALSTAFSSNKTSEDETQKILSEEIQAAVKSTPLKTVTKEIDITCNKVDGKWLIASDDNLANIILANMYTVFSDMANSFKDTSK